MFKTKFEKFEFDEVKIWAKKKIHDNKEEMGTHILFPVDGTGFECVDVYKNWQKIELTSSVLRISNYLEIRQ